MFLNNRIQNKRLTLIAVAVTLFIVGYILLSNFNNGFAAQMADNILRPLIGNSQTLALESWYFNSSDNLNKIESSYQKPSANIFNPAFENALLAPTIALDQNGMKLSPITPTASFSPLPAEGNWEPIQTSTVPQKVVIARTFIRPDNSRNYAIVSLVKMNMKELALGLQAGTYYPGGVYGIYGKGYVPSNIQQGNTLVAVFNGGFMAADGHYGMILDGKTYVPLKKNMATLLIHSNGQAQIINYTGQTLPKDIIAARQNGPFLIQAGHITSFDNANTDTWGRTTTDTMYTWRSGIGITNDGNLIYAVGNSLVPATLAKALQSAGAVNAIQLDINPFWVRYIIYDSMGGGKYDYYPLLKAMQNGGYAYLHGYNKDFFYVYRKINS